MLSPGANALINAASCGIIIDVQSTAAVDVDVSLFLLGSNDRVRNDLDMVFYGQPSTPDQSLILSATSVAGAKRTNVEIDLRKIDPAIHKIAVTATIDRGVPRAQSFAMVGGVAITIAGENTNIFYDMSTAGAKEVAMIIGYIYRHSSGWKFRALGQGFTGGLKSLGESFGVTIEAEAPQQEGPKLSPPPVALSLGRVGSPLSTRKAINLEKIISLEKAHPKLAQEARQAMLSLEKAGQTEQRARVELVVDISASMQGRYASGAVNALVRRVLAIGLQMDDDGEIDVKLFGRGAYRYGTVNKDNYESFTSDVLRTRGLEGNTMYSGVMQMVRDDARKSSVPTYVMFVTDGDCNDKEESRRAIVEASHEPIFWQFMGIGQKQSSPSAWPFGRGNGEGFDFLSSLDEMSGRFIDNANFFAVSEPDRIANDALFDLMMAEYPMWLKQAKQTKLLR